MTPFVPEYPGQTIEQASSYGYIPSEAAGIAFLILFAISGIIHCIQGWKSKYWIVYPTLAIGAFCEALGWGARIWSHKDVLAETPFLMQICVLIFSPAFFSAFCYTAIGIAIRQLGQQYSFLSPKWYLSVFMTADVISLMLQAIGGGIAASSPPNVVPVVGNKLMLSGIIFQLISMVIFTFFAIDFVTRLKLNKPYARHTATTTAPLGRRASDEETIIGTPTGEKEAPMGIQKDEKFMRNWTIFFIAIAISSVTIITRGIFRSAELSQGWGESIMLNENLQIFLDGMMMVIAVGIFNVFHPLWLLPKKASWKGYH